MSLTSEFAKQLTASLELYDEPERDGNAVTNPKILGIAKTLNENPLLVEPVKRWIDMKMAEMARAQLGVLYTPDELLALQEQWKDEL